MDWQHLVAAAAAAVQMGLHYFVQNLFLNFGSSVLQTVTVVEKSVEQTDCQHLILILALRLRMDWRQGQMLVQSQLKLPVEWAGQRG
jgi:hypothetical protein